MADKEVDYGREVRETIFKSSLTGVAATVLAVTLASPAGFGGMIGTSLASGAGSPNTSDASGDPYSLLPAYPTPLTPEEVSQIRGQLAATAASLEITRAATEAKIEFVRGIALRGDMMVVATTAPDGIVAPSIAPVGETAVAAAPTPTVEMSSVADADPVEAVEFVAEPILAPVVSASFSAPLHDPHLELAALLLDENL